MTIEQNIERIADALEKIAANTTGAVYQFPPADVTTSQGQQDSPAEQEVPTKKKTAKKKTAKKATKKEEPEPEPELEVVESDISLVDLRKLGKKVLDIGAAKELRGKIRELGAEKLTTLDEEHYPVIKAYMEELIDG